MPMTKIYFWVSTKVTKVNSEINKKHKMIKLNEDIIQNVKLNFNNLKNTLFSLINVSMNKLFYEW